LRGDFFVVGEDGVAALDGGLFGEEGAVVGIGFPGRFFVPLEVADSEDELGDGGGAFVDFKAEELVGADFEGVHLGGEGFVGGDLGEEVEDFGFEFPHAGHRDVEEVAGAAGGVEDLGGAELVVEVGEGGGGFSRERRSKSSRRKGWAEPRSWPPEWDQRVMKDTI